MALIADILMTAGALSAAFYCIVLSRRLTRFNDLEKGIGGAVAVLSAQVDDLKTMLGAAQTAASTSTDKLEKLTSNAEKVAQRLELLVASMHDLPLATEANSDVPEEPVDEPVFARKPANEAAA
ncbi:hypothetical protein [Thalassobium sp. R2A62]|jgi:hypothetical protein|uniref:hypothetical protein n=1 Tax=Thalassobium sp. R2A62 TaxID=633131 RepID=UPI0001B1CD04|nr:hypothetical protein [Thalassobium sp. R2A62]EET47469.1 hypothetical protein TR2A62_2672 [Thalassobium sp. R2A62]MDG1339525.1 hypothetical protein [Paracoccaceae bacterium]MDG1801229.1 hypothetical protein [Paracoccaceae bacterium]MDG2453918.1 hypothetical protein [Paracoccaceae bacterium]